MRGLPASTARSLRRYRIVLTSRGTASVLRNASRVALPSSCSIVHQHTRGLTRRRGVLALRGLRANALQKRPQTRASCARRCAWRARICVHVYAGAVQLAALCSSRPSSLRPSWLRLRALPRRPRRLQTLRGRASASCITYTVRHGTRRTRLRPRATTRRGRHSHASVRRRTCAQPRPARSTLCACCSRHRASAWLLSRRHGQLVDRHLAHHHMIPVRVVSCDQSCDDSEVVVLQSAAVAERIPNDGLLRRHVLRVAAGIAVGATQTAAGRQGLRI